MKRRGGRYPNQQREGDSRSAGFSTLEAIVAVGILAIALLPLYEFQLAIVDGAGRLEDQFNKTNVHEGVESYLRALQPSDLAAGREQLGDIALSWSVAPADTSRPILNESGLAGRFSLSLVKVRYTAEIARRAPVEGELTRLFWIETAPFFAP